MRERIHFIGLWLDEKEYGYLQEQCSVTGLSVSALIRKLIAGTQLRPRPPDQYAALLRELSAIGNNVNQLAAKANSLGFVDAPMLYREAERWHKFQADIESVFLRPDKSDLKWQ